MFYIKELSLKNSSDCYNLISNDFEEKKYFYKLGWNLREFTNQFSKENHFGLGIFINNTIKGFMFGDLILIDKKKEYEILLLYVNRDKRKLGYATSLLKYIQDVPSKNVFSKIYLEVASNNKNAINLYKKNEYKKIGLRKKYYNFGNKKINAYLFEKNLND